MIQKLNIVDLVERPRSSGDGGSGSTRGVDRTRSGAGQAAVSVEEGGGVDRRREEFGRVYRSVAEENRGARQAVDRGEANEGARGGEEGRVRESVVAGKREICRRTQAALNRRPASDSKPGEVSRGEKRGEETADEASGILRGSLQAISEELGLTIVGDIGELDLSRPTDALVEQFSEIVAALRQVAGVLEEAFRAGETIEIGGRQLDPSAMMQTEQVLHMELFRMQIAMRMLGVAAPVAAQAAGKQQMLSDAGLVQAIDPSSHTMSHIQLARLLQDTVKAGEQEVRELCARALALASKDTGGEIASTVSGKPVWVGKTAGEPAAPDFVQYDTPVMRKLLKIDLSAATVQTFQPVGSEEKGSDSLNLLRAWQATGFKALSELSGKVDESSFQVTGSAGKESGWSVLSSPTTLRLSTSVFRHIEESVMNQILDKVKSAVRGGADQMRFTLKPESLGEVRISIRVHEEVVTARIHVESIQIKQIVETNLSSLRDALAEHNLEAGEFEVDVGEGGDGRETADARRKSGGSGPADTASSGEGGGDEGEGALGPALGTDTGRRYGVNTIEYYI